MPYIRQEIELIQPYKRHVVFTHTQSSDVAENVVSVSSNMEEGNKIALIVELNDVYIEFDADASSSSLLIPAGNGYFDEDITIDSRISAINASAGSNARIRGIVWGR